MSLRVWLPLTGHLDNQGLSDITVTNNGATVDNSGKLGQCYIFTGSEYLRIDKKVIDTEQYSISMWFNTTTTSGHQCLFNTRKLSSREVAIYILSGGTLRIDTSSTWSTIPITTNTWYHIVFVQNATTQYLYVNGVQSNTRNATSVIDNISNICTIGCEHLNGASLGTYFRGKINDVRIYDHALSPKEVKLLSKGLVAHYQLNDNITENDFNIVYDSSGYNYHGKPITTTLSCSDDTARNTLSTQFNGTDDGVLIENLPLSNIINSAVTYSFWIKPNGENGARSVYFGSYSGVSWSVEKTTGNILRLYWNGSPDETCSGATISDGVWQHICITKYGTSDVKVYINGVQKWTSTANHANLTFPTTYRIGRDVRSGDGTPYKGLMSDFRIYATALSAQDILELYQAPVSISNTGAMFTQGEFIES